MDLNLAAGLRNCHTAFSSLHAQILSDNFSVSRDRENLCTHASNAIEETQLLILLYKHLDSLENDIIQLRLENSTLKQEKSDLQEHNDVLQERLTTAELKLIDYELNKEQEKFIESLGLGTDNPPISRVTETVENFSQENESLNARSPFVLKTVSLSQPEGSPAVDSVTKKRINRRRYMASRENTPESSGGKGTPGNFTIMLNKTFGVDGDELDLEELTDKLGWYESVIRKLQTIFGIVETDPDITYHQESNNVITRAKRMVQYKEMITDYEKMIADYQDEKASLEQALHRSEMERELVSSKVEDHEKTMAGFKLKIQELEEKLLVCQTEKNKVLRQLAHCRNQLETFVKGRVLKTSNVVDSHSAPADEENSMPL